MSRKIDISGQRFGRLLVLKRDTSNLGKWSFWLCQCDCGNIVSVKGDRLKRGLTSSCGCFRKESFTKMLTKHGMSNTKIYRVWQGMKERCYSEKHKSFNYYGGRGITVCDEWMDKELGFIAFYEWSISNGYSEGLTLDRSDNEGNYEPSNCKWTTRLEQGSNMRSNINILFNGEEKTLTEWSRELGIGRWSLKNRYDKGIFPYG